MSKGEEADRRGFCKDYRGQLLNDSLCKDGEASARDEGDQRTGKELPGASRIDYQLPGRWQ